MRATFDFGFLGLARNQLKLFYNYKTYRLNFWKERLTEQIIIQKQFDQ